MESTSVTEENLCDNLEFTIDSPKYKIIQSGSVIVMHDNPIDFKLGKLIFRLSIKYNNSGKNHLTFNVREDENGQKYQSIEFNNPNVGLMGGLTFPINLAKIGEKKLSLILANQALASHDDSKVNMLVNYTWLLEK